MDTRRMRFPFVVVAAVVLAVSFGRTAEPGAGELLGMTPDGPVSMPILSLTVDLAVHGIMLQGTVVQEFVNSGSEVIDAVYVLPLPDGAAVNDMELRIGERRIVSVVREKEEAQKAYEAAKSEGRKAALVAQSRSNLFRTAAANVNPGERVTVRIQFVQEVRYRDGLFQIDFPLTYTPRYSRASASATTDTGGFASPALAPRARIRVRLAPGLPLESVRSSSHEILVTAAADGTGIEPQAGEVAADRDFLLAWKIRRDALPSAAVVVEDREDGSYALLMMFPPDAEADDVGGLPTDTLFVVDVSGSMDGPSIAQAREALVAALDRLRPGDAFNILRFNDATSAFAQVSLPADTETIDRARAWVNDLRAGGGTEIVPALLRGIEQMQEGERGLSRRIVLITDGAVENEEEAFRAVASRVGDIRLHVLGIGAAPNRHLMRKLVQFGRGTLEFIGTVDEVKVRMSSFLTRLERPVLTDVRLEWEGAPPIEAFPERLPDLHAGEPVFVSLRLGIAHPPTRAVLRGIGERGAFETVLDVDDGAPRGSGIATRWARAKVDSLVDRLHEGADPAEVRREAVAVATEFRLVTPYTSLVAIEEAPTADGPAAAIRVPNGSPVGSTILPQGGTWAPLRTWTGVLLLLAAAGMTLLARVWRT